MTCRYVDGPTQINVDISFNEPGGIENTKLMKRYVEASEPVSDQIMSSLLIGVAASLASLVH